MRILYLSNFYYPFIGGAEEVCRMEAEALAEKGHEISVITTLLSPDQKRREQINGVNVYRIGPKSFGPRLNYAGKRMLFKIASSSINYALQYIAPTGRLVELVRALRPDIVHAHNMGRIPPQLLNKLKELGIPVVMTLHDYRLICPRATLFCYANLPCEVPRPACRAFSELNKLMLKESVKLFIAPSKFVLKVLRERLGDIRVEVLYNPIKGVGAKRSYGGDTFDILYIGRLEWYKGVHVLLKAFSRLKHKCARLLIVGKGPLFETAMTFSQRDKRVIPLGFLDEGKKRELLREANITVVPSLWHEPFPMVALESLASGTPVIASKVGGIPEIVKDGYNGRLFEPGDSNQLSDILAELIENGEKLSKLAKGAIESAQQYLIDKHINKLEEYYKQLLTTAI